MTTKEKIAIMQAYADGKEIEYKYRLSEEWETTLAPNWNWGKAEYRVKPDRFTVKSGNLNLVFKPRMKTAVFGIESTSEDWFATIELDKNNCVALAKYILKEME